MRLSLLAERILILGGPIFSALESTLFVGDKGGFPSSKPTSLFGSLNLCFTRPRGFRAVGSLRLRFYGGVVGLNLLSFYGVLFFSRDSDYELDEIMSLLGSKGGRTFVFPLSVGIFGLSFLFLASIYDFFN